MKHGKSLKAQSFDLSNSLVPPPFCNPPYTKASPLLTLSEEACISCPNSSNKNILLLTMLARYPLVLGIILLILTPSSNACTSAQYSANGVCYACYISCLTCTSSTSTSCLTCGSTRFLNGQTACQCNDGYVEQTTVAATCVALTCSYTCLTCNNTATACTSCTTSNNRIYISTSLTCPCIAKYYDSGSAACTACHYTCGQCTGSTSTTCTYCDTTAYRTLSGTTCPCNAGYYDSAAYTCAACNHACATCVTSAANCLTCGANRGSAPSCPCSQGFYDDGISIPCIACSYSCQNCSNGTSCNICNATNFRLLTSISPLCVCMNRYYDAGVLICSACDPRCYTCLNTTVCLTCSATAYRTYASSTKFCNCMTGYYETSTTVELCSACNSRCLTCATSSSNCLTCDPTMNRVTNGAGGCPCNTGFYENSYVTCSACDPSCYTCTNGSACTSCVSTTLEIINSTGLCSCPSTMFLNTTLSVCQTCNYRCATCQMYAQTNCLTCPASSHRTYNNFTCLCNIYYYDDGSSSVCQICDHTCNTCSSSTSTTCLTCNSAANRYYSSGSCLCKTYFYDNGAFQLCQPCMYNCLTCTDATSCSTCDSTLYRTLNSTANPLTCACSLYYFETSSKICAACLYHCFTCNSLTNCLTCDATAHRVLNITTQLCDCKPGYYGNFVDQICLVCLPECYTCTNATTCTSCSSSLNRMLSSTNRCPCTSLYFDVSGVCTGCLYSCSSCASPISCTTCNGTSFRILNAASQCVCSNNYFDDGSHELCLACSYACLTCVSQATQCVTCDTTLRIFQSSWCACPQYFYDNNSTVACMSCHYTCSTCQEAAHCLTCNSSKFRTFDSIQQYCVCMVGYYDDGSNQLCLPCNFRCQTCTNSTICLICNPLNFRDTPTAVCPCLDGYYDDNSNQLCPACHYTCNTCTNGNQCLTCDATTNYRTFDTTYLCKCIDRFYDDGAKHQLCLPCVYSCMTCSGSSTTCTTCNSTAYRTLSSGSCNCLQHFYDNLAQLCLPCHYTCLTCIKSGICTTCNTSSSRAINTTNGLCSCMNMFWDDGSSSEQCNSCEPTCLTCTDTQTCITCNITRNRMLNSTKDIYEVASPYCVCLYRYYSPASNKDCQPCHYSCQVCTAGTRNSCVICNTTAQRTFSISKTSCPCNDGYYDTNISELCLPCNSRCTLCTTGLYNSCTVCSPLYYLLIATTTCYDTCPNFYFNYQENFTCQSCSKSCQVCLNQTYCIQCASGTFLYKRVCQSICPSGTYAVAAQGLCNDCPSGCKVCNGTEYCSSCINNYYYNSKLQFCFSCNTVCLTCSGPGQSQCLSCASPLHLTGSTCSVLSCASGTYVDPVKGCQNCSDLFTGSLTCNINQSFSCGQNYKMINSSCIFCNNVPGYSIAKGICGQICGDGLLIYLQCDDGNNINGDGCSSNCLIQQGWSCNGTGPSLCSLKNKISISVIDYYKKAGANELFIYLNVSLPIVLSTSKLSLTIAGLALSQFSYTALQKAENLSQVTIDLKYTADIQSKNLAISYQQTGRLLEEEGNSPRLLIDVSFSSTINLNTYPPAVYYSPSVTSQFTQLQYDTAALSICLLVLSLILVPKKMHLHALTVIYLPAQIFLSYGLVADDYTDWIKYTIQNTSYSALIGGFSYGNCCTTQSTYFNMTSELMAMSGIVFFVMLFSWLLLAFLNYFHSRCLNIQGTLKAFTYLIFTLNLALISSIVYSSMNTLYHFILLTPNDTFNLALGLLLSIFFLLLVAFLWVITYLTIPPIAKSDRTVFVDKQVIFEIPEDSEKITENSNTKRKSMIEEMSSMDVNSESSRISKGESELEEKKQQFFLNYDYQSLYNHANRVMIKGQPTLVFSKAKYFLPLLITKVYLNALLSSLMQSQPFYFFIVSSVLELSFIIFMLAVKPFTSKFTNFRIIFVSLLVIAANIVMQIYIYNSMHSSYLIFYEELTVYLIIAVLATALLFLLLEHLMSWSKEMWRLVKPCLKGTRLMGHRLAKAEIEYSSDTMRKSSGEFKASHSSSFRGEAFKSESQEIDAFYARMLKKEQLNKDYRRQRMMK